MFRLLAMGAALSSNGKPPPKPLNPGPIFGAVLLVVIGIVAVAGYQRHLTVGLLVAAPIICVAVVMVGAIAHGMPPAQPKASADKISRMRQVQALLQPRCGQCGARPGASCVQTGSDPMAMLDAQWNTICHFRRMEEAVRDGYISRANVVAQWDGHMPEGLRL